LIVGVRQITFNGKAVFDAIEKNGIEHVRSNWYGELDDKGQPLAGCVLGIGAFNLGIAANPDYSKNSGHNLEDQLNRFNIPTDSKWYTPAIGSRNLGQAIIYWNDLRGDNTADGYELTWPQVVEMARDLLTPYFNEVFTADQYVFEMPGEGSNYGYAPDYEPDYEPAWS
jgi:hypothetical protein